VKQEVEKVIDYTKDHHRCQGCVTLDAQLDELRKMLQDRGQSRRAKPPRRGAPQRFSVECFHLFELALANRFSE
jgi:hypothetical protein